jgi:3D (Asp-Asp-Asp) domain-containing protein
MELTYYWVAAPREGDDASPLVPLLDLEGQELARVHQAFAERIALEGTGRLADGRLVNVASDEVWPQVRFMFADTDWGLDARGEPLVPYRSVAVDPALVPLGTHLYAPALDGLRLPDGTTHDGCLLAADVGTGIQGAHLDLFAGTREHYEQLDQALGEATALEVQIGSPHCP